MSGKPEDWDAPALFQIIRQLQPQALINDRAGLPGDFDTPEQQIGPFQKHRPWESCITLGQQWAWKPDDELKSLKECLHTLVRCAGGDGNLLLNVGPMPTGQIEPRQAERLLEMGQWLAQYGQSIYSTRGGPWMPSPWGASTHQANTVYLHLLDWPTQTVKLPPVPATVVASRLLTGGRLELKQSPDGIELTVPREDRQPIDTIVVLELDRPACDLPPVPWRLASGSLAFGKPAAASNVFRNLAEFGPDRALDDDPQTRWATDYGIYSAWLEVDLGTPTSINQVRIREAVEFGPRVRQFELQYREGETWRTCLRGTEIGDRLIRTFPPITAQHVRLNILEAAEGPTIWEFQLFGPSPGGR